MDSDYRAAPPKCFDPRLLARLKNLEVRAQQVVDGYLAGVHRSAARGGSLEFSQHRDYAPGDDPRYVDWKAFARTGRLQLKQFEDETNLVHYLVIDASASMFFTGPGSTWSKWDYAASLAASAAWLALANQDAVSLTLSGSIDSAPNPPSMHPGQFPELLRKFASARSGEIPPPSPLTHLVGRLRRRGLVLLLTDALCDLDALASDIGRLRHQGHEVRLVQILDDAEIDFPYEKPVSFRDLETAALIAADSLAIREAYQQEVDQFLEQLAALCAARRAPYCLARTSESLERPLRFLLTADAGALKTSRSTLARSG